MTCPINLQIHMITLLDRLSGLLDFTKKQLISQFHGVDDIRGLGRGISGLVYSAGIQCRAGISCFLVIMIITFVYRLLLQKST